MNNPKGFLFTAGIVLATAFTLSCEEKNADKPSATVADTQSSSSGGSSSSSDASSSGGGSSSSVGGLASCLGFVEGTPRQHHGQSKAQFCDGRDGQKYVYVTIGTQTWMAENLNYAAEGSRCYDDKEENCKKYGRLYMGVPGEVCPAGWRVPIEADWKKLENTVGNETAGTKLKASKGWKDNGNGTDDFGFEALPGGYFDQGRFYGIGEVGRWWSTSLGLLSNDLGYYYVLNLGYDYESVSIYFVVDGAPDGHYVYFSVRCIQESNDKEVKAALAADKKREGEIFEEYRKLIEDM